MGKDRREQLSGSVRRGMVVAAAAAIMIALVACQPASGAREGIAATNQAFMDAVARGDGASMGQLYTEEGQALPPNSEIVQGEEAIGSFWQAVIDQGLKQAVLETVEIEDRGDTAFEVGKYTLLGAEGQIIDSGKFLVVWKNEGGRWQLHRDMWSSNRPAAK